MQSLDTSPRSVYRWAMQHGWTSEQAGSWAAYCSGVPIVVDEEIFRVPWTVRQINVLLFYRHLSESGQLELVGALNDPVGLAIADILARNDP